MKSFAEEWAKTKRGEPSSLFASDLLYGVHTSPKHSRKVLPQKQRVMTYPQPVYANQRHPGNVWSEYGGHSMHRTPGVSPILLEAQSKHAHYVFTRADYVLSKLREKW